MHFDNIINNRELSVVVWIGLLMIWILSKREIWKSVGNVIIKALTPKLLIPILFMAMYLVICIYGLFRFNVWDFNNSKGFIHWFVGVAIVTFYSIIDIEESSQFFKKLVFSNLTVIAFVEFFTNFHPFPFIIEFFLFPIIMILAITKLFAADKPEFKPIQKPVDILLSIYGVIVILYSLIYVYLDYSTLINIENIKSILLPIAYTIFLLPFIYLFALFVNYETIYTRLKIANKNTSNVRYSFFRVFLYFNFRLNKLIGWSKRAGFLKVFNRSDIDELLSR